MGEKLLQCNTLHDTPCLLSEIIITLRAAFGMPAAVYDESKGGLIIPDDYSMPELVEAIGLNAEEPKVEDPEPEKKVGKAKGK